MIRPSFCSKKSQMTLIACSWALFSCADANTDATADSATSTQVDAGELCTDVDVYTDGLEKIANNGWTFRFTGSMVNPPDRGVNTFTIEVVDGDTTRSDLTVIATPRMPHHNHGTFPSTFSSTASESGFYELGPMDLFMSGRWEISIEAYDSSPETNAAISEVTVAFCLEG